MRHAKPIASLLFAATCCMAVAPAFGADETGTFTEDLPAALEKAKTQHKDLLLDFTGSDWCGWCIKLDKEVFEKDAFKSTAPKKFELVKLDFPQKKPQPNELKQRNKEWSDKLHIEGFPSVVLLDENARVYATTGYQDGGADAYLKHLDELQGRRLKRDAALALAAKAEGIEKAKQLDAALTALADDDVAFNFYALEIEQIVKLDADNSAGLKEKYQEKLAKKKLDQELETICNQQNPADILKDLLVFAQRENLPKAGKQQALAVAANVASRGLNDLPKALELTEQAIAVDPSSELAKQLRQNKDRLTKRIEKLKGASATKPEATAKPDTTPAKPVPK